MTSFCMAPQWLLHSNLFKYTMNQLGVIVEVEDSVCQSYEKALFHVITSNFEPFFLNSH